MKILVISDTHGQHALLRRAIGQEAPIDILVHAGDIEGSLREILGTKREYAVYAVAGNMDWLQEYPDSLTFEAGGHRFYVAHGHRHGVHSSKARLLEAAKEAGADVAVFGHTHIPYLEEYDDVILLNPGSAAKPRQNGWQKTYAVIEIPEGDASGEEMTIEHRVIRSKGKFF
ncbi:MAG: metallophosphoesterase [Lachnospiraceae bacterium]|nr:metallophosphoesterase [Lachnospiraceae bacterium]